MGAFQHLLHMILIQSDKFRDEPAEAAKLNTKMPYEKGVFLDPNHSYYILIDDTDVPDTGKFKVRENLEREIRSSRNIPNSSHGMFILRGYCTPDQICNCLCIFIKN